MPDSDWLMVSLQDDVMLSVLRLPKVWGLSGHGHQIVNFLHVGGGGLASVTQECDQILLSGHLREEL